MIIKSIPLTPSRILPQPFQVPLLRTNHFLHPYGPEPFPASVLAGWGRSERQQSRNRPIAAP